MTDDEIQREIKPHSPIPASREEIISDLPDRSVDSEIAANLVGMRRAHLKKVIREGLDETAASTISLQQLAEVYARMRPQPAVLCDSHFTTDDGLAGLTDLIDYLENPNGNRWDENKFGPNKVHQGSAVDHIEMFPEESVQTVITSPPYWGMRVYSEAFNVSWSDGTDIAFGGESTPEEYIRHTLEFLLRMRPILKETGTIWWNVGDVYNTRTEIRETSLERMTAMATNEERTWADLNAKRHSAGHEYLKDKDLTLIPYQIGKGLQRCGFYVRSVIVWRKQNVVPETVGDRPTVGHEVILLISKSKRYKFNESRWRDFRDKRLGARSQFENENLRTVWDFESQESEETSEVNNGEITDEPDTRPIWEMPPAKGEYQHAAPFPVELPGRCIMLSTEAKSSDLVYDPFLGSGTTAVAATKTNRPWVGSEISEEYKKIIENRLDSQTDEDWDTYTSFEDQKLEDFTE
ncbi:DNA-methyltransferase [Haloarcula marina]|uniref:DNA-methyltransferase n=1 Tax=Haloarcula marina TaxID=2961574 RepID=UPI0020B8D45F|nr:site-specific DNA-methyltransferase [Halomicroarcula marina]